MDSGNSFSSKTFSQVQYPASASPGIAGTAGTAPVAITNRFERIVPTPSTTIVDGSRKRPAPK